ncbi:hypothetical protein CDL12_12687 [Handroanthus impetiginosus]|uniref:Uncharacterized protein n=1 Tax=Handroanthus impetiginosus TaxID=429701 RepID=A0A2G9HAY2_9LAMI|nr:hypothetical protein CDL12_12687 [Handroanthus impetiginosus]
MAALSNSLVVAKRPSLQFSSGSSLNLADQCVGPTNLAFSFKGTRKSAAKRRTLVVQASYSDGGRPSTASIFVGGFVLGGLIVGTLGCAYAPQISRVLADTDKKELMKKLPKFIYDEEKVLEKQRKKLAEKIAELNASIDNVSSQWRPKENSNEAAGRADDIEAVA